MAAKKTKKFPFGADICKRKEAALQSGEFTDFSFLVGPEGGKTELMHCFKSDLMLASDYFRAMLRSPLTGPLPIRMKHVQPHIFKIILRFITFYKVGKVSNISDAVALLSAADEFLLDEDLKQFFRSELETLVTVANVWETLAAFPNSPQVTEACTKVLTAQTRACLEQPAFKKVSKEGLLFLLQIECLAVKSEKELLDACLALASKLKSKKSRNELVRAALPHLRLLTLKASEIEPVLEYLNEQEQSYLSGRLLWKEKFTSSQIPEDLCSIAASRQCPAWFVPKNNPREDFVDMDIMTIPIQVLCAKYDTKNGS